MASSGSDCRAVAVMAVLVALATLERIDADFAEKFPPCKPFRRIGTGAWFPLGTCANRRLVCKMERSP